MSHITHTLPVLLLASLAWPSLASARSLESEIASANRIYAANAMLREGKIAEAIDGYQQVQATAGARDALAYNLGVAQYRGGDIAAAKEAFTAAAASSDASLAASSRYNLGNCLYSDALQQAEQDKAAAIASLRDAIEHYRGALRGNPNNAPHNADARANIELASELIRKLEEEQEQDRQQEQQDQQQQEQQNQQQNQDQQQQGQNNDQQNSEKQQDNSESSAGEQSEQEEQSDSSQQQSEDAASDGEQQEDSETSDKQEQQSPQDSSQQQDNTQSQHSAASEPSAEEEVEQSQEIPQGELSAAGGQEHDQGEPRAAIADANADDGLMSKEEALKMLQAVRDRDMLRRLRQQQAERSRHVPVDRDW